MSINMLITLYVAVKVKLILLCFNIPTVTEPATLFLAAYY